MKVIGVETADKLELFPDIGDCSALAQAYVRLLEAQEPLRQKLIEAVTEVGRLKRENELLRAVAEAARMVLRDVSDEKLRPAEIRTWVLAKTYKAAIDGGALEDGGE